MRSNWFVIAFVISLAIQSSTSAQELKINGGFVQDSIKVGEDVIYYLTARYPRELNILFPDSTVTFFPFEYHTRRYFPTHTDQGISYDSVVFYLRTFETDSIQHLALPVYVIHPQDCTVVSASLDSIAIKALIRNLPDSVSLQDLPLKETVSYETISTTFNYIILTFVLGILLLITATVWTLFGKKIKRFYQIKRLQKNHIRFLEEFNTKLSALQIKPIPAVAESTATLWKKYLENLESRPYTKLTTKEIVALIQNEQVKASLHSIDRAIYGNHDVVARSFDGLINFAENEYRKRLEEVMNE
ncbi:MAG TPA: hypothetical protein VFW11_20430 [Cyclobacteriaceae bacterium]|nr:hypothetical protein [Cyclobacteriaceae bacterium]